MNGSAPASRGGRSDWPGRYVYGIVHAAEPIELGPMGMIGSAPVYSVPLDELAAVICHSPLVEYESTRENLLSHGAVVELIARRQAMVPLPFGTVLASHDELLALLRAVRGVFTDVLERIRGKVELLVRVTWQPERVADAVERSDPAMRQLRAEIDEARAGSTYFARQRLGRLRETALREAGDRLAGEVVASLRPLVTAMRTEVPHDERVLLEAACVADRERVPLLRHAVGAVAARHEGALAVSLSGPWPPHRLLNVKLELERIRGR